MENKRKGFINISREFLLDEENKEALSLLFSHFTPLAICNDRLLMTGISEFHGVCDYFEELEPGTCIREYVVEFERPETGPLSIKFIKQ